MKKILQNLSNGETFLADVPIPKIKRNYILIKTNITLISLGTEKMLIDFGNASFLNKARQQPEKVKQVLQKVKNDGIISTFEAVNAKLKQPISLGYSSVGEILEIGENVKNFKVGDRVVSNSPHEEYSLAPKNLCVRIPKKVNDETAVFTVVSSIGLQGIRLAKPSLGENFVVFGAGLIGLLTIQMLIGNGCNVLAIDIDEEKLKIAKSYGAKTFNSQNSKNIKKTVDHFTSGIGADGVIIAATSKSDIIIKNAAEISRYRGRIILVGVTGLNIDRNEFYEKEITFQVSCSYGPGRYDHQYEVDGIDYPIGLVRWTEQRNFASVLNMMEKKIINVEKLITKEFDFSKSIFAYSELKKDNNNIGVILKYKRENNKISNSIKLLNIQEKSKTDKPIVGFIGSGNYASRVLIPIFKKQNINLHTIVSEGGVSATLIGKKFGFFKSSSNTSDVFSNSEINTVVIATRHDTHAKLICDGLKSGKNIFVEKPLAINNNQISKIKKTLKDVNNKGSNPILTVGFNRRFSPHITKIKTYLDKMIEPKLFIFTMNAGEILSNHWTQNSEIGGGRIIGESCHYIDLMRFLSNSPIAKISLSPLGDFNDTATINIEFENGSIGTIFYLSNGSKSFPKERIEIFCQGTTIQLDDFKQLRGFGDFSNKRSWFQNKGQEECIKLFINSLTTGDQIIPLKQIFEVAEHTINIANFIKNK